MSQYGKKWAEGVRQRGAEGGIWTAEGASDRGLKDCIVRSVLVCTVMETGQMDGACGTNEGQEWCIYGSDWET
jgi:hypothetical protein